MGGQLPRKGSTAGAGHFYPPTIITGATPAMRIWQEEVFGPVMTGAEGCQVFPAILLLLLLQSSSLAATTRRPPWPTTAPLAWAAVCSAPAAPARAASLRSSRCEGRQGVGVAFYSRSLLSRAFRVPL